MSSIKRVWCTEGLKSVPRLAARPVKAPRKGKSKNYLKKVAWAILEGVGPWSYISYLLSTTCILHDLGVLCKRFCYDSFVIKILRLVIFQFPNQRCVSWALRNRCPELNFRTALFFSWCSVLCGVASRRSCLRSVRISKSYLHTRSCRAPLIR